MQRNVVNEQSDTFQASTTRRPAETLVVGLGNPILGDDGIGWRVAEEVQRQISNLQSSVRDERLETRDWPVEVDCVSLGGLSLMERLIGYRRAIVIDAIQTGERTEGSVVCFPLETLPDHCAGHTTAAHDTSLRTALEVGRTMGALLPDDVLVVGVEARQTYEFSEELTPPVAAAIPAAVDLVKQLLRIA